MEEPEINHGSYWRAGTKCRQKIEADQIVDVAKSDVGVANDENVDAWRRKANRAEDMGRKQKPFAAGSSSCDHGV